MLTLRRAQWTALHRATLQAREKEIFADVCELWAHKVAELGEDEARRWVRSACRNARAFGIDSPRGLYRFTNLTFFLGKDFHRDPNLAWARHVLESSDLSSLQKVDCVMEGIRRRTETEVP